MKLKVEQLLASAVAMIVLPLGASAQQRALTAPVSPTTPKPASYVTYTITLNTKNLSRERGKELGFATGMQMPRLRFIKEEPKTKQDSIARLKKDGIYLGATFPLPKLDWGPSQSVYPTSATYTSVPLEVGKAYRVFFVKMPTGSVDKHMKDAGLVEIDTINVTARAGSKLQATLRWDVKKARPIPFDQKLYELDISGLAPYPGANSYEQDLWYRIKPFQAMTGRDPNKPGVAESLHWDLADYYWRTKKQAQFDIELERARRSTWYIAPADATEFLSAEGIPTPPAPPKLQPQPPIQPKPPAPPRPPFPPPAPPKPPEPKKENPNPPEKKPSPPKNDGPISNPPEKKPSPPNTGGPVSGPPEQKPTPPASDNGGWKPPTSDPGSYKPPTSDPGSYKPPTSDPGSYKPPTSDPGSYKPPTSDPGSYKPPTSDPGSYKPPTYDPGSYKPPTYDPSSYSAPQSNPAGYSSPQQLDRSLTRPSSNTGTRKIQSE